MPRRAQGQHHPNTRRHAAQAAPPFPGELTAARDRAALAAALGPIITIDHAGTIQSASDSVRQVLGWTPNDLIGRNVNILMPGPHRSAHDGCLADYQRTGRINILNRPLPHPLASSPQRGTGM